MSLIDRTIGTHHPLETEDCAARQTRKWEAVRRVVDAAWTHCDEFAQRMKDAGLTPADLRSFEDFARIPVLRKKEIIGLQQDKGLEAMLSCRAGDLGRIYMSPGPLFDPEGREADYWGWAEGFYAAGFRPGDLVQMTFSYHLTPAGLMLEEPLRAIGCAVIPAGPGNTDVQIELLTRLPVTGFVGMASYLKVIKDKAKKGGNDLAKAGRLRVAFVAAERLAESLRRELEDELGMLVRQGYGTADVGCIAYECGQLTGMHVSSRAWVEICDPKTGLPLPPGETGEVVVTPFPTSYPLVRLATGDLSFFTTEPCACGRTSVRLGGIVGRVDATAKVKGQFIYPHQVAEVAGAFPVINRWQVVVSNPGGRDAIAIRVELAGELDQEKFVKVFQDKLKLRPGIIVVAAGDIAPDAPPLTDDRTFEPVAS
ncbi:MAG: phenylacetate--CoA ligase family protein [Desulfovibrionaceae bacterium]